MQLCQIFACNFRLWVAVEYLTWWVGRRACRCSCRNMELHSQPGEGGRGKLSSTWAYWAAYLYVLLLSSLLVFHIDAIMIRSQNTLEFLPCCSLTPWPMNDSWCFRGRHWCGVRQYECLYIQTMIETNPTPFASFWQTFLCSKWYKLAQHTTPIAKTHRTATRFASEPTENLKMFINIHLRNITIPSRKHHRSITTHHWDTKASLTYYQNITTQSLHITETRPRHHRHIT